MTAKAAFVDSATQTIDLATGETVAFRRLGPIGSRPLVLLQHFRGNLDNWDPALIDALAKTRDVVVFDNVGVGASTGQTPHNVTEMAHGAIAFVSALELVDIDLLGYSIGGFVAQEVTLIRPSLVHRLVLAATAPQGAQGMHGWVGDIIDAVGSPHTTGPDLLHAFFRDTPTSQAAGKDFLGRFSQRTVDRDAPSDWQTRDAHYDAVVEWGIPNHAMLQRLEGITQPVFVANGDDDRMILPKYSRLLAGLLPDATLKIYPDSAHAFLFQHHAEFAADVDEFLNG